MLLQNTNIDKLQDGPMAKTEQDESEPSIAFMGLLMGTATVPDIEQAADEWCAVTRYQRTQTGVQDLETAHGELWGIDLKAHPTAIVLRAPEATGGFLRLVTTDIADYEPDVKGGRAPGGPFAYEFMARDVDETTSLVRTSRGFRVIGGPLDFDNGPAGGGFARAARVVAPGGFTCLFNTIQRVPPPRKVPVTDLLLSAIWNAPVTAADRTAVERFYGDFLGMPVLLDGVLGSDNITATNQFPSGWAFHMLVYGAGAPMQMIEIEIHPASHVYWPIQPARRLLRGNAITTLLVESLDPIISRAAARGFRLRGPVRPQGFPYAGRRVAAVDGPNREMFEFLEVGS